VRRPPPQRRHPGSHPLERGHRIGLGRRSRTRFRRLLDNLTDARSLQEGIAALEEELQDDERKYCPWCGSGIDARGLDAHVRELSMKQYWGPLQFDDDDEPWGVALLVNDEWRWMDLVRPCEPGRPYHVMVEMCSERCLAAFTAALRRDTALRRPH
jgi:hypothetical protein